MEMTADKNLIRNKVDEGINCYKRKINILKEAVKEHSHVIIPTSYDNYDREFKKTLDETITLIEDNRDIFKDDIELDFKKTLEKLVDTMGKYIKELPEQEFGYEEAEIKCLERCILHLQVKCIDLGKIYRSRIKIRNIIN